MLGVRVWCAFSVGLCVLDLGVRCGLGLRAFTFLAFSFAFSGIVVLGCVFVRSMRSLRSLLCCGSGGGLEFAVVLLRGPALLAASAIVSVGRVRPLFLVLFPGVACGLVCRLLAVSSLRFVLLGLLFVCALCLGWVLGISGTCALLPCFRFIGCWGTASDSLLGHHWCVWSGGVLAFCRRLSLSASPCFWLPCFLRGFFRLWIFYELVVSRSGVWALGLAGFAVVVFWLSFVFSCGCA